MKTIKILFTLGMITAISAMSFLGYAVVEIVKIIN